MEVLQVWFIYITVDAPVVLRILRTEASDLTDLTKKSAKKLLAEPPATVGPVLLGKRAKLAAPLFCAGHPLECERCAKGMCSVDLRASKYFQNRGVGSYRSDDQVCPGIVG